MLKRFSLLLIAIAGAAILSSCQLLLPTAEPTETPVLLAATQSPAPTAAAPKTRSPIVYDEAYIRATDTQNALLLDEKVIKNKYELLGYYATITITGLQNPRDLQAIYPGMIGVIGTDKEGRDKLCISSSSGESFKHLYTAPEKYPHIGGWAIPKWYAYWVEYNDSGDWRLMCGEWSEYEGIPSPAVVKEGEGALCAPLFKDGLLLVQSIQDGYVTDTVIAANMAFDTPLESCPPLMMDLDFPIAAPGFKPAGRYVTVLAQSGKGPLIRAMSASLNDGYDSRNLLVLGETPVEPYLTYETGAWRTESNRLYFYEYSYPGTLYIASGNCDWYCVKWEDHIIFAADNCGKIYEIVSTWTDPPSGVSPEQEGWAISLLLDAEDGKRYLGIAFDQYETEQYFFLCEQDGAYFVERYSRGMANE